MNINVTTGNAIKLLTSGKFCEEDITVNFSGGSGGGCSIQGTWTWTKSYENSEDWFPWNNEFDTENVNGTFTYNGTTYEFDSIENDYYNREGSPYIYFKKNGSTVVTLWYTEELSGEIFNFGDTSQSVSEGFLNWMLAIAYTGTLPSEGGEEGGEEKVITSDEMITEMWLSSGAYKVTDYMPPNVCEYFYNKSVTASVSGNYYDGNQNHTFDTIRISIGSGPPNAVYYFYYQDTEVAVLGNYDSWSPSGLEEIYIGAGGTVSTPFYMVFMDMTTQQ